MTTELPSPGRMAEIACTLEVCARKPGNVHPERAFSDAHYLEYLLSATAIAGPLDRARTAGVGAAILEAVEATRRVVSTNTNLGMILILAPMAAVPSGIDLVRGIATVLEFTTIEDARLAYRAIRLAQPGGLGTAPEQDVAAEPTVSLWSAMCLAAHRDLVARQYANSYTDVFKLALPALRESLHARHPLETAIITAHLTLLANCPDTLIARKRGIDEAHAASRRATEILAADWPASPASRTRFEEFDAWLRSDGHSRNPGATADLVSAALFAALRDGTIPLPRPAGPSAWSDARNSG